MDHNIDARLPSFYPPIIDKHDRKKKHVTIGFDFAGIVGPCMALSMLGIPYTILWANESDESCRKMLRTHWQSWDGGDQMMIFNDATAMDLHSLPSPDIYIATPPCQSFSSAGNQQGTTDERGRLIYHPIQVVKTLKPPPKIVVIENVMALLQRHKLVYDKLVSELEETGYTHAEQRKPRLRHEGAWSPAFQEAGRPGGRALCLRRRAGGLDPAHATIPVPVTRPIRGWQWPGSPAKVQRTNRACMADVGGQLWPRRAEGYDRRLVGIGTLPVHQPVLLPVPHCQSNHDL